MTFFKKIHLFFYNLLKARGFSSATKMRHIPSAEVLAMELANLKNEEYNLEDLKVLSHATAAEFNLNECVKEQDRLISDLLISDDLDNVEERMQPIRNAQKRLLEAVSILDTESHKVSLQYLMWRMREQHVMELIQGWMNKQGHEQCWYYPEIFNEIARTLGVKATLPMNLPPREEFRAGCCRFENEIY